jgi:hypothetical protein
MAIPTAAAPPSFIPRAQKRPRKKRKKETFDSRNQEQGELASGQRLAASKR